MTIAATEPSLRDLEAKLDALGAQLAELAGAQSRSRASWNDLSADLAPVATVALERLADELDELGDHVDVDRMLALLRRLARSTSDIERLLDQLERFSELAGDVAELGPDVFVAAAKGLDNLERRGYVEFARGGLGVLDRVVTSFGEDDIAQLGDNIVLILHTVKEMTQPEVMRMLQRTARVVREDSDDKTPTLRHLLRDLRDPAVKRGLHRMLSAMRSLSPTEDDPTPTDLTSTERRP